MTVTRSELQAWLDTWNENHAAPSANSVVDFLGIELACRAVSFTSASASLAPTVGNGRRRSTTERGHKTEPNFYRRRNNDDRHADC